MKVHNENCLATMAQMKEGSVDLVVTSPPYDDLRKYNGYSFEFEKVAQGLFRVVKQGGVVVWVVGDATKDGNESGTSFKQALYFKQIGFNLYDTMLYRKANPVPNNAPRYEQEFEYMFVFSKGKPVRVNLITEDCKHAGKAFNKSTMRNGGKDYLQPKEVINVCKDTKPRGNIWSYAIGGAIAIKANPQKHPATFPEALANDHILSWSNEGDLVYDPFTGSGTTGKMAIVNNRRFVGSEISQEFCEIAHTRLLHAL